MHQYDLIIAPLIALLCMAIGLIVYFNDRKSSSGKVMAILSSSIGLWILSAFLSDLTKNLTLSILMNRLIFASIICFMMSMLYLSFVFPNRDKIANYIKLPSIIFSILFAIITMVSPFIVATVKFESWGSNIIYGKFFMVFVVFTIIAILVTLIKFTINYIKLKKEERYKIRLFFIGLLLVSLINVLVQVVIRNMVGSDEFYRFGNYSVVIFVAFTAYAIIRHQLFNVKILLTETAVAIVMIAMVLQFFASKSSSQWMLNGFILLVASYGGYLIIKSVIREIRQREDLAILSQELKEANGQLQEVDKMKDDFLSMASHELNTPIAAIEGYLSMILVEGMGGKIPAKAKLYLESVFQSSKRLASMVKDLLNVSRIESGRVHIIWEQKPLEDVINQAVMEVNSKALEAKHKLTFEKPKTKLPMTWFDITRVTEVLINIIGNAIKYTDPGGIITVRAMKDEQKIVVSIEDNGRGIPKDRQEAVFAKFSQVDTVNDQIKGTGLGMYISMKFIELMNGKIWFHSDGEGKGTTFFFSLPIIEKKPFDTHEGEGSVLH